MTSWLTHNLKDRTLDNKLAFNVEFNFHEFSPMSFKKEAENVCIELHEKYGNDLFLAFSGGADSEFILKTFIELSLPIKPVLISCPFNQYDIKPAFSYCKKNNIELIVLEYGDEYLDIAHEKIYNKGLMSPIGLTPLLVYDNVKNIGGKVISGQGEPLPITNAYHKTLIDKRFEMFEFEYYMDVYAEDQPAPFYSYNQNIFYSYLNEIDKRLELEHSKCKLYKIHNRIKTYWSEAMYKDIAKNKPLESGFSCEFNSIEILEKMKTFIV